MDKKKGGDYLISILEESYSIVLDEGRDDTTTNLEGTVHALVRNISNGNVRSIKTALERVDGKVSKPVEIRTPRIVHKYINAKTNTGPKFLPRAAVSPDNSEVVREANALPSFSIRGMIEKLEDKPKTVVHTILENKTKFKVVEVIAAKLYDLAHHEEQKAIDEILDQIDGKVADVIEILGEDIELLEYQDEAPINAILENGVYVVKGD